jgi:hypothetical protein
MALRQARLMRAREIARQPLVDLREQRPEISVTRKFYVPSEEEGEKGEWETEEFDLELPPARARLHEVLTTPHRLPTERGLARRAPVGSPFTFEPGERPGDVLPGPTTLAEQVRHQALLQKVKRGADWPELEPGAPTVRMQMREMAKRGATVVVMTPAAAKKREELALAVRRDRARKAAEQRQIRERAANVRSQDDRLRALTHGSAAFNAMTTRQKYYYLDRLTPSFPGSRLLVSMKSAASKAISSESVERSRARSRAMAAAANERARVAAAGASTRAWLNQVQAKKLYDSTYMPGYDRVPHGVRQTLVPGTGVLPPMPAYVSSGQTRSRPMTSPVRQAQSGVPTLGPTVASAIPAAWARGEF